MKKAYEILIILRSDVDEKTAINGVKKVLDENKITVTEETVWGLRTLAYPIKKQKQGRYVLFVVESPKAGSIQNAQRELLIHDNVMRFTLVALGK